LLDEMSVTATENAVMAAVLARGTTIIRNAASEPHVQDLCHLLNILGARIEGIGSNTLTIHGVDRLGGGDYRISPDYLEVGSFLGLGAVTRGEIRIHGVVPEHLRMINWVFSERLGVSLRMEGDTLLVGDEQDLRIKEDVGGAVPKIDDAPWPQFPADLMSIALVVATQARGTVLIHEKMFESRLYFVDKLIAMGARIILCDPHRAVIVGPSLLHGQELTSPDIRAGMALLIAALAAEGTSSIVNVNQIDRGYEAIDAKLRALGAHIQRVHV
jgi:UDP-N-acetylglucosamine 1-carboxyvinyltransferase